MSAKSRREITPHQQATLDQGERRLDLTAEGAAADRDLAERRIGLQEQGVDLQRQGLEQRGAHQTAQLAAQQQHREATLAAQSANQPLMPVVGPDGVARYAPRSEAVGQAVPKKDPLVNIDNKETSAFAKEKGKQQAKRYGEIIEKGANARQNTAKLQSLLSLNDTALSGFGADVRLEAARAGNLVGLGDGETVAATEAMNAGLSDKMLSV